jgi:general secretion pathway protein A
MYASYYGLRQCPFDLGSDLRFLFLPEGHREALSHLEYGIAAGKGVTVLTGEVGTGKTTLVRAAIAQAPTEVTCIHLTNPRLTPEQFFEFIGQQFGLASPHDSKVSCLAKVQDRLVSQLPHGRRTVLIVDEAQSTSDELIEEIRLLTNMEISGTPLLSVIIVGQPEFAERLNTPALRHLKQRVALRCTLRSLTLVESAGYIASRIRTVGGDAAAVFTREAVMLIHEASGGVPRIISVLCDNALVTGYALHERPVGSGVVRQVCRDFDIAARETIGGPASHVRPALADPALETSAVRERAVAAHATGPRAPETAAVRKDRGIPLFRSVGRR